MVRGDGSGSHAISGDENQGKRKIQLGLFWLGDTWGFKVNEGWSDKGKGFVQQKLNYNGDFD